MTWDTARAAKEKAAESGLPEQDWLRAFENARHSLRPFFSDDSALDAFARASASPARFTRFARLLYQFARSHPNAVSLPNRLLETVNASPFSLKDWIDAIDAFHEWLIANERKVDFLPMLKYLECCVAAPEARNAGQTLTNILKDMLSTHGYVG